MVKLAKKKIIKGFRLYTIELPRGMKLSKDETVNLRELERQYGFLSSAAIKMLMGMYAISDAKDQININDSLEELIGVLINTADHHEKGIVNLKEFRIAYKHYKGMLDNMFAVSLAERRKAKKFGDPKYPTLENLIKVFDELERVGFLDENGNPKGTKYDAAIMKQRLVNYGVDLHFES